MQNTHCIYSFAVPGTLAANITIIFKIPYDMQLVEVQAVATNASSAAMKVGTTADDDAYLLSLDIGDSSVPAVFSRANFVGAQYPHILKDTIFQAVLDFDGAAGTAAQNVTLVFTFTEG